MSAAGLFDALYAAGLTVTADGEELVLRPAGRVTPGLLAEVRAQKPALLALLRMERFCHICQRHSPDPCDLDDARHRWAVTPCRRFAWRKAERLPS